MDFFYRSVQKESTVAISLFFIIFFILLGGLYATGLVPDSLKSAPSADGTPLDSRAVLPSRIVIPKISVDAPVLNPETRNVDILNEFLSRGAVRYPDSGTLTSGNMFIFGHNTSIKVVKNKAYQTFDGLRDLKEGDLIEVYSTASTTGSGAKTVTIIPVKKYTYVVKTVKLVSTDDEDAVVEFSPKTHMLTIATCNVFGKKQERYVVEASFLKVE